MALTRLGLNQAINLATNTTGNLNLASQVTGTLATGNGGTGATSFAAGKILQYKRTVLSSSVTRTGTSFASVMTDTITCSSTSTYLLVICTVNYRMNCNDNTSNPYGNIRRHISEKLEREGLTPFSPICCTSIIRDNIKIGKDLYSYTFNQLNEQEGLGAIRLLENSLSVKII